LVSPALLIRLALVVASLLGLSVSVLSPLIWHLICLERIHVSVLELHFVACIDSVVVPSQCHSLAVIVPLVRHPTFGFNYDFEVIWVLLMGHSLFFLFMNVFQMFC